MRFGPTLRRPPRSGGQALVEAADRLSAALDASMRLALLDALSEASMELGRQLSAGRIEVRLAGREVELTYVADAPAPPAADDDASARITLRLPERLKADAEAAAAREGVSTNAWLVRAVSAARRPAPGRDTASAATSG